MSHENNGPQLADVPENAAIFAAFSQARKSGNVEGSMCAQCALNGSGGFAVVDGICANPNCVLRGTISTQGDEKCEACSRVIPDDEDILEMTVTLRDKAEKPIGEKTLQVCEDCARQSVNKMLAMQGSQSRV